MTHRDSLRVALKALAILGTPIALAGAQSPKSDGLVTVGANVQVSKDRPRFAHYEHLAGAHARDANKMMACSMMTDPAMGRTISVVYTTVDGGATWRHTLDTDLSKSLTGDPVCVYGAADTAFFLVLSVQPNRMFVYRSADAGLTWTKTDDMPFIDRENLVVDQTGGKYNGRIYINGTGQAPGLESGSMAAVTLFRSTDGGHTFAGPALRAAPSPQNVIGMGPSVILSDGTIVTLFGHQRERGARDEDNLSRGPIAALRVVTSKDGGETLSAGVQVADWYMARERSQGAHIPWLAVDPGSSAFKDRLYAVWDDYREGRLNVLLSWSSDKGKTWSKPVHVVDDRPALNPDEGPDEIMPLVAVNKDGVVGVAWYDRRDQRDDAGWDVRFAASLDGGETFSPSVKVSSASNRFGAGESWPPQVSISGGGTRVDPDTPASKQPLTLSFGVNSFFFSSGHTSGFLATADGLFHPVWEDNRTGVSQLWTAPVTVHGVAVSHGSTELAALSDVTDRVTIDLSDVSYDRSAGTITTQLRLRNTSKDTLTGPVKARVIAVNSDVGVAHIVGADNGMNGTGAVLDLTPLLPARGLLPDSTSAPRNLTLRVEDIRPFKQGRRLRFGLAALDARVYAPAAKRGRGGAATGDGPPSP